ncbi:Hypothetical protein OINT_1001971 [Brucella intermedia LMG 3301]|uniref:Uncharacterized protein n=1 Tax=Brucella intermedia LMG 3301 TaxID=641118 RepID=C4WGQ4_9HYPH|nr:Hypothetical protein OINT_1001971 [Brucella intermedia LMG 3301]
MPVSDAAVFCCVDQDSRIDFAARAPSAREKNAPSKPEINLEYNVIL